MRADNSFAFAFNKIAPPESNSPEALRAYANKVNRAFEEVYEKVFGHIDEKNLSPKMRKEIDNKVESKELDKYTLLTQTDEKIALEASRVDGHLADFTVRADGIEAAVQTADGKAAQAQLTADGASTTASSADGKATQALQTANEFSWKMRDLNYSHEIRMFSDSDGPGIGFFRNGETVPDLTITASPQGITIWTDQNRVNIMAATGLDLSAIGAVFGDSLLPDNGAAGLATVGSASARWKKAYWVESASVSSDLRLKQNPSPLGEMDDEAGLLYRLKPIRYRLKSDPKKLHFGFGAQHVQEAIKGTTYEDAALLADEDPDHLGLCYEELIAVLVEGYQKQQARIAALERRISALEVTRDDRR